MKKILFALLFVTTATFGQNKQGVAYNVVFTRVIDGDTVAVQALWLPDPLKKEISIRIYGVDTPEKGFRAKCKSEDNRGQAATVFTKSMVDGSTKRQMVLMDWDKYGGRVLGDLYLETGENVAEILIHGGWARPYRGEKKKPWTFEELTASPFV